MYAYIDAPSIHNAAVEQILRLEPSEKLFEMDGMLVMVKPFELKIYDEAKAGWATYPFTTQFCSSTFLDGQLFTFHQKETLQWSISQ